MTDQGRLVVPSGPLRGSLTVPGDKSISHRALILAALAHDASRIRGLSDGDDVARTAAALRACGVHVEGGFEVVVTPPTAGWTEPRQGLDFGNSGTGLRLMLGVLASKPGRAVLTGDASLRSRPMERVVGPLRQMGARIDGADGGHRAPLTVHGHELRGGTFHLDHPSAQVKSALLLAGLGCGVTVHQKARSRDHTERLLRAVGAPLRDLPDSGLWLAPGGRLDALDLDVPGDLSAAAFWLVAASIVPGSDLVLEHVGLNPTRTGLLDVLRAMGADLEVDVEIDRPEPSGRVQVRAAALHGVTIDGELALRTIDELPVVAIAAAFADGETTVSDAADLRDKESDRIARVVSGLRILGADADARPDGFVVRGGVLGGPPPTLDASGDHRLAMAFAVAGLARPGGVRVAPAGEVHTSYPRFFEDLAELCTVR
jgi:3-phosphoshikimate 1-carboxyvinyltransferase